MGEGREEGREGGAVVGLESPQRPLGDSPTRRGTRFGDEVDLDTWRESRWGVCSGAMWTDCGPFEELG